MNNEAQHSSDISSEDINSKVNHDSGEIIYDTKKEPRKSMGVYLKNQNRLIMNSIAQLYHV